MPDKDDILDQFFEWDVDEVKSLYTFDPELNEEELRLQYAPKVIETAKQQLGI